MIFTVILLIYTELFFLLSGENCVSNNFGELFRCTYRKVASSRLSRLVAHLRIFRLFMKGKIDDYVLWLLAKRVQNWIVDRSSARDFTVCKNICEIMNQFWRLILPLIGGTNLTFCSIFSPCNIFSALYGFLGLLHN